MHEPIRASYRTRKRFQEPLIAPDKGRQVSESTQSSDATALCKRVRALLDELQQTVSDATRASILEKGIFGCALRAALAKSFEFATLTHSDPSPTHGFFITATLRGICEDLIVLTFLDSLSAEDRNRAMMLLIKSNVAEGIEAQSVFFEAARPWQPVLRPSRQGIDDTERGLRELSAKLGWTGRQAWPTVWFMAKASSLAPLYSYLYSATSKWVHFSPHIFLRMGWGGKQDDVGDHTEWIFTTANFAQYYADFNQVYALLLLLRMLGGPAAALLPANADKTLAALRLCLDEPLRWPEAVTFEEMNFQGPNSLMRILMRASRDIKNES
jgi:hypothetical protein